VTVRNECAVTPGEELYDPEYLQTWRKHPLPRFSKSDVEGERAGTREYFLQVARRCATPRDNVAITDASAPSLIDGATIPIRIYRREADSGNGALVYLHGSAFVLGDLDIDDQRCLLLARDSGCVIVSVDYRLAPEHRYPVPLEDCYSVVQWVAANADDLTIDRDKIGVGGTSAGGALAAGVTQLALDRGGPHLAMQMLLYAMLDASLSSATMRQLDETKRRDIKTVWERYMGTPHSAEPSYASPASRSSLRGLPPAYVAAAEFDLFRDEAIAYARALQLAAVPADLRVWPRVPHAFDQFVPEASISRRALADQAKALSALLC
jgi:acetyl esterase